MDGQISPVFYRTFPLRDCCPAPPQPKSHTTQAGHRYCWPLTAFRLLLGSGLEGVLLYGEFSPSPSSPPPSLSPPWIHVTWPKFQSLGLFFSFSILPLNHSLKAQVQERFPMCSIGLHPFWRCCQDFFLLFSANWVILGPFLNPWRDLFCNFLIHILLLNIFQTKPAPKFFTNLLRNSKNNKVNSH